MERRGQAIGIGLVVLSAIGYAGTPTLAALAYEAGINVPTTLTLRFGAAALLAWPFLLLRREAGIPRSHLGGLALAGALFVANTSTFFLAIRYAPASTVAAIFYSYPAIVTLLAVLWLGERLTLVRAIALALAMIGCLLTLGFDFEGADGRGMLLAFASACFYAGYIVVSSRVVRGLSVVRASTWIMSGMALMFAAFALLSGSLDLSFQPRGWLVLATMVVASTVVAVLAFLAGVMRLGPARASIIATLEPVMAVALAAVVLREDIGLMRALGGLAILTAVVLLRLPVADAPARPALDATGDGGHGS